MDLATAEMPDDLLAILAQANRLERQIGIYFHQAGDIADCGIRIKAKQQIRRGEMEKMQRVRLNDLSHVQQLP